MWLICDQDQARVAKTKGFLERHGVRVLVATREDEFPTTSEKISLAIFSEGWHPATLERIKRDHGVQVLLCLPQQLSADLYAQRVQEGYADVIAYPPAPEYVKRWEKSGAPAQSALESILQNKPSRKRYTEIQETIPFESQRSQRRAQVIAVVGVKGGVGKSTVSSLLASTLKQTGKRVVVADLDPQGNLAVLHQVDRTVTSDRFETLPNSLTDAELEQNMVKTPLGIWLIPKGERPLGPSADGVQRLIHLTSLYADVVLLDCHPGMLVSTDIAMKEADRVLAVTTSDRTGWTELPAFLKRTEKPVQLVLNRVREKRQAVEGICSFLQREIGCDVAAVIEEDSLLYDRVQQGLSLMGRDKTMTAMRGLLGEQTKTKGWWKR